MVDLPPGIVYLAQWLPTLAGPPAITYLVGWLAGTYYEDVKIPSWALRSAIIFSLPVFFTIKVQWRYYTVRRELARLGAILPPLNYDPLPGGLSLLLRSPKELARGYPGDLLGQLCKQLGNTFNVPVFFEDRIVTTDPEYIKALLATQSDQFEKGPEQRRGLAPLLGTGVFAADGELWKFHRAMTRPFFTKDRISHFELFDRHSDDAIKKMRIRLNEGLPIDLQDAVARFTMDTATEFLFGHSVGSLSESLPYPFDHVRSGQDAHDEQESSTAQFIRSFSAAQDLTALRLRFGDNWAFTSFWKDEMKDHMKIVHGFIDPIVASVIKKKKETTSVMEKDEETLLENLVNSTEDPTILRDEIMNLLVAGRDTTASLLTFTVYMLCEHPEVFQQLREEVLGRIGPNEMPTFDDFREMKYLRAVLNETLRLYPPVPFNMRVSKEPTLLPPLVPGDRPIYIPSNVRVPYSVMVMQRREDLWGPDALEFDPDRFLDERLQKYLTPNPFIFLPFNAGPRICLGQQFAYHEASFFLVRLLQDFSAVSLAPEAQSLESRPPAEWATSLDPRVRREKIKPKAHLTMYVHGGLWVKMAPTDVS